VKREGISAGGKENLKRESRENKGKETVHFEIRLMKAGGQSDKGKTSKGAAIGYHRLKRKKTGTGE